MPASSCSEHCLPPVAHPLGLRAVGRGIALAVVVVAAALTAPLLCLLPSRPRSCWLRVAAGAILLASGVQVRVNGPRRFGDSGVLVVANHVSWIEVLAIAAVQPVRLIAKREIRRWFLIGTIAAATGALFMDRRRLSHLPGTITDLTAALRAGDVVAVFPEGTTWCGAAAGPFRRAAFQAALDAGVPVRPVAVTLRSSGQAARDAAFVARRGLLASFARVLRMPDLVCELTVLPVIPPSGDRAWLAARAGAAIADTTGVVHAAYGRGRSHVPTAW